MHADGTVHRVLEERDGDHVAGLAAALVEELGRGRAAALGG
jgi:hypothetical protein